MDLHERIQTGDWKKEKHVPVIESPDSVTKGEWFSVDLSLGKEIGHPNTTEHHIRWISLFFHPDDEKFTYEVGHFEFTAHGESVPESNQGPVTTNHQIKTSMKINKPGSLYALALCNIHGLWQSTKKITVS